MKTKGYYNEGGFLDDGASVDPISGNEVPTGSLQEEVRDDIPAQLSEGEFVFPADVVRFIGLGQLMKIRDKAKTGLVEMEEEGQIGGSAAAAPEIIMDDEDMAMDDLIDGLDSDEFDQKVQNFARGGMPTYDTYKGIVKPDYIKAVQYTNDAGDIIDIRFFRGSPLEGEVIPEGYYPVGDTPEDKPEDKATVTPTEVVEEAVDVGGSNQGANRDFNDNGGQRKLDAALVESQVIRGARIQVLETMHVDNMTETDMNILYDSLSPQARTQYEENYRNPKGIDSFMIGEMNEAEKMLAAQKTVDSRNQQERKLEPKSVYTPNGNKVDWKDMFKNLAKAMTGGFAGELSTSGVAKKIFSHLQDGGKETVGNDNGVAPTYSAPVKYDQAYWAESLKKNTKKYGKDTAAVQQAIRNEKLWASYTTGLDPYGRKLTEQVGFGTIWDQLTDEQKNDANTSDTLLDPVEVESAGSATVILSDLLANDVDLETKLGDPSNNVLNSIETPTMPVQEPTLAPMDVDEKLIREMSELSLNTPTLTAPSINTPTSPNEFSGSGSQPDVYSTGESGNIVSSTPAEIGATYDGSSVLPRAAIDRQYFPDSKPDRGLMDGLNYPETKRKQEIQEIQDKIDVQKRTVQSRDALDRVNMSLQEKSVARDMEEVFRLDNMGKSNDEITRIITDRKNSEDADDRRERNTYEDKSEGQRSATRDVEKAEAGDYSRGGGNPSAKNTAPKENTRYVGGQYRLAEGGLASKNKPTVKKMRTDNTSGLAAKKKSKDKAKAKKGALAAKRT